MHENHCELIEKSINFKELLKKSKNILYEKTPHRISLTIETITSKRSIGTEKSLNIIYGINETPFGKVLLAKTDKGISDLLFITASEEEFIQKLFNKWPNANFTRNEIETRDLIEKIFYSKEGISDLNLHISGTDFQLKVWQSLLSIPEGFVTSYSDLSEFIKHPNANRAVGTAIGQNPIHFLIPCHRVIKKDGNIGGFAAGTEKKQAILTCEAKVVIQD